MELLIGHNSVFVKGREEKPIQRIRVQIREEGGNSRSKSFSIGGGDVEGVTRLFMEAINNASNKHAIEGK